MKGAGSLAAGLRWAAAALALAVLAWQGHRLAGWLPQIEQWIAELGPWAPLVYMGCALLLAPLLVPDTIFGVTAGVVFGLGAGTVYYCAASYGASLVAYGLGRLWLRRPVLVALRRRPPLWQAAQVARSRGAPLVFWLRLIPMSPAMLSYALAAVDVPFRAVALGTLGMLPHLFLTVYFGAAAAHVTRMAARGHRDWGVEGLVLGLGLVACAALVLQVTRIARREVREAEGGAGRAAAGEVPTG